VVAIEQSGRAVVVVRSQGGGGSLERYQNNDSGSRVMPERQ